MRVPSDVLKTLLPVARAAREAGTALFAVGGCVRDWMLGAKTRDLDLVVEGDARALAERCARLWGSRAESFDRFGTVRVAGGGFRFDFARARAEDYPEPAALPVVRPASLVDDLVRRDFTVNAMALPLSPEGAGALVDPHGGAADLAARRLRVLHDASFSDDPTRLFRAARYGGRLGLSLEPRTARLLRAAVRGGFAARLSRERLRQELMRILEEPDPGPAMRRLKAWGLFKTLHPRFRWVPAAEDAWTRLGRCALAMGAAHGEDFLRSLPLAREQGRALVAALKAARAGAVPPVPLPPLAARVLEGSVPPSALMPRLLRGEDLKASGVEPGPAFAPILERAARAQWRGAFSTRAGARAWLEK